MTLDNLLKPIVFDASIMKWRKRTVADDEYVKAILAEFGL